MSRMERLLGSLRLGVAVLVTAALAACSSSSDEMVLLLEVDARTETCVGVDERECLLVREQGEEEWELFYETIEGFTHEAGFRYLLEVARTTRSSAPADASIYEYRLLEVLSREAVD